MEFTLCLVRTARPDGGELIRLGHPLLDAYLDLVTARARPNTVLATAFDLKVFFRVIDKEPVEVLTSDVLAFIKAQREPLLGAKVVRIEDGESGLSARTIKRRLASIAGLYEYLIIRGDTAVSQSPVPRGLALRRPRAARGSRHPVDPGSAHVATCDRPCRRGRVHGCSAHRSRPSDGGGDAVWWPASL